MNTNFMSYSGAISIRIEADDQSVTANGNFRLTNIDNSIHHSTMKHSYISEKNVSTEIGVFVPPL